MSPQTPVTPSAGPGRPSPSSSSPPAGGAAYSSRKAASRRYDNRFPRPPGRPPANQIPPAGVGGKPEVPIYLATCSARPDWLVGFRQGEGRGAAGREGAGRRRGAGRALRREEEARPLPPPPPEGRSGVAAAGPRAEVTAATWASGGAERGGM